jgi:hypothetical protein
MNRTVVIADVDGVLYDYVGEFARVASAITGLHLSNYPTAEVWDVFTEQWGITRERFLELLHEGVRNHGFLSGGLPLPGAQVGWRTLRALVPDARLHIVTNVGWDETAELAKSNRCEWLSNWGFNYDDITFTDQKKPVAQRYLDEGYQVFTIDDLPQYFEDYCDIGAQSYLAHQRWNRRVDAGKFRVGDFADFADVVVRHVGAEPVTP